MTPELRQRVMEAVEGAYAQHFMGDSTNGIVLRESILAALEPILRDGEEDTRMLNAVRDCGGSGRIILEIGRNPRFELIRIFPAVQSATKAGKE